MKFKKGQTYHINRGPGKPYKIYILAIIEKNMIVFQWYGRHKQYWHYEIKHKDILEIEIEKGEKR